MRSRVSSKSHHKLVCEMTREEHFLWNEKKRIEAKAYRDRKKANMLATQQKED